MMYATPVKFFFLVIDSRSDADNPMDKGALALLRSPAQFFESASDSVLAMVGERRYARLRFTVWDSNRDRIMHSNERR